MGGLVLTSEHEDFGGLSGIRFLDKTGDTFLAITDKARVISGTLNRTGGKPNRLSNTSITRIRNADGKTITGADDKDAESLEISGTSVFVGYERNHRILRLTRKGNTLSADRNYQLDLNALGLPGNSGAEGAALDPVSGKLFILMENATNADGNHRGYFVSDGKIEREISVRKRDLFSITDAAFLDNGDLIVLERYYNPLTGVFLRMRHIEAAMLKTDQPLDGDILIDLDSDYEIDNMEGLAVSHAQDGSYRLTLVSDDNFSDNQRTILLEFMLLQ